MSDKSVTSIVVAGLGGQGVLKSSDILAEALFLTGQDVKKAEVHGMSQRGGSVASDVRFGEKVWSPMAPPGEADFLVVLSPDQVDVNRHLLREGGVLITPDAVNVDQLANKRSLNVALLGILSAHLDSVSEEAWTTAIRNQLGEKIVSDNLAAFALGRQTAV